MDKIKKQMISIITLVVKHKSNIAITLLILVAIIFIYKLICSTTCYTKNKKRESFSNDALYSYRMLSGSKYHHAELTSPDNSLISAIAKRYVKDDGSSSIEIVGDLYLLNKNVFGDTVKQEYRVTLSKGEKLAEVGVLEEKQDQTHKLNKNLGSEYVEYDTLTIFHVVYDKNNKPESKILLNGVFV